MVGLDTFAAIWNRLSTYYASHTRATIKKLHLLLHTPKNDRNITNYLLDIKKTVDSLSAIGACISTAEHIDAILDVSRKNMMVSSPLFSLDLNHTLLMSSSLYSLLKKKGLKNTNSCKTPLFKQSTFLHHGLLLVRTRSPVFNTKPIVVVTHIIVLHIPPRWTLSLNHDPSFVLLHHGILQYRIVRSDTNKATLLILVGVGMILLSILLTQPTYHNLRS